MWLRPRDLGKIGQLVLNPSATGDSSSRSAWIDAMTAPHSPRARLFDGGETGYGYLWWRGRVTVDGHATDWVGGMGWGGQRLYVVPSLDLVRAGSYRRSY